ncbi:C-x8-C-x5-C-x3-H type zinc finger protein [Microsporum canis CBS 113480]|uniref:C-x8-C-x5-C-x3-H type zinc finger protein n=1 Tax=Arthroderma otae (strain ATCC MYA-4605 / CBS 113480) TaxID=554155 RepID=C5FJY8_ARTOC|nr:C-x8-C-x5-C-x3-H type zinc finger protein [Microsporum canis CBS 113480]EEQ30999.1 C-x8-C-x5-C-x3-H type zinc finger protein [Microsporum canis CBS 113480]
MSAQEFFNRYEQLKAIEQTKNHLIEVSILGSGFLHWHHALQQFSVGTLNSNSTFLQDLLNRITELEDAYRQKLLDHDREAKFNREVQIHEMELMEQLTRFKSAMGQEPFVIALIDGDGMIFQDSLVQQGEQGGKDAANQLWLAIRDYTSETFTNIHSPKIVARIYANVRGLGETLFRAGIIDKPSILEAFVRGFNGGRLLFDFVDVGSGKDRADDKIAGSYRVTKFDNLFRESKIVTLPSHTWEGSGTTANSFSSSNTGLSNTRAVSRTPPNSNGTATTTSAASATSGSSGTAPTTWASTIAASANTTFKDLTPSKPSTPSPPVIERNKYGQRVDRIDFKAAPKDELNRVKKLKLCNLYFLLGDCPNPNCYHTHDYKLGKQERIVLQVVARMTPCHFGTECDDATCIYGHRCPLSEVGKKDCYWGSNCRFDADAHGVDTNIVKLTKV